MSEPTARPELDVCECRWHRYQHVPPRPHLKCGGDFKFLRPATPAEIAYQDRLAEWEKANPCL